MGAVIFDGGTLVTAKTNTYKTHPKLKNHKYPHLHAEERAIYSIGLDNCCGKVLVVARVKKDNAFAMAKPCVRCREVIRKAGFRRVFYTTDEEVLEL